MDFSLIKIGDVILTAGKDLELLPVKIGNVLHGRCKARQWTHAAMSLGSTRLVEAVQSGVRICDLKEEYYDKKICFLALRYKKMDDSRRESVGLYCQEQKGDPYDWRALSYFVLNSLFPTILGTVLSLSPVEQILNVNNSFFCSELVAAGFLAQGVSIVKREPWQTMPVDFLNLNLFDVVLSSRYE